MSGHELGDAVRGHESGDDAPPTVRPGPTNSLTDVAGIRVGHHSARGDGWLTGVTVVLAPDGGAVGGVDVRGGGPGTRETDLLDPRNVVERLHAVTLSGGSAYGLAAAVGVVDRLARDRIGLAVGPPPGADADTAPMIVPIVPGAVIFDLGRGGGVRHPDADMGAAAYDAARGAGGDGPVAQGNVGAGTGAVAGHLRGGVGSASAVLADGSTVAALLVVNPAGSPVDPETGALYGSGFRLAGEGPDMAAPSPDDVRRFQLAAAEQRRGMTLNTTLAVVATDATLTKGQCAKVAGIGHDGMARGIRPVHSMLDGDTVFTLATGERQTPDLFGFQDLLSAAADCVTRAVVHAVLAAEAVTTPGGSWPTYRDTFPSAFLSSEDR